MLIRFICSLKTASYLSHMVELTNRAYFGELVGRLCADLGLGSQDLEYLENRLEEEGTSFFTKRLPVLGKALDRSLATGLLEIPLGFKRMARRQIPHFMGSLFIQVFDPYSGRLLDAACPVAIRAIRQICYSFYKIDLPYKERDKQAVIDRFLDNERDMSEFEQSFKTELYLKRVLDPSEELRLRKVIARAVDIVSRLVGGIDVPSISGRHSSGTVTQGYTQSQKLRVPIQSKCISNRMGWHRLQFYSQATDISQYPVWDHDSYFQPWKSRDDCSEVLLVPKDSRGPRLICREPCDYQYLQQGMKDALMRVLESHPISRGHINFTDQTVNQNLAKLASESGEWATLDLKDASDRNPLFLVKLLWSLRPAQLEYLLGSRTSHTYVDGRYVELAKFAPMGSALCFPVMAVNLFALLSATISAEERVDVIDASKLVYVYGDDIIVPSRFADLCMRTLETFGFKVNKEKSFVYSRFAESCGTDWFDGCDVNTIKVRSQCLVDQAMLVSTVETANLLAQKGMRKTAEFLYTFVEGWLGALPYGSPTASYLSRWAPSASVGLLTWTTMFAARKLPLITGSSVIKAWVVVPETEHDKETVYSRLQRVLPLVGKPPFVIDESTGDVDSSSVKSTPLPGVGEFTHPRRFTLRRKRVVLA